VISVVPQKKYYCVRAAPFIIFINDTDKGILYKIQNLQMTRNCKDVVTKEDTGIILRRPEKNVCLGQGLADAL